MTCQESGPYIIIAENSAGKTMSTAHVIYVNCKLSLNTFAFHLSLKYFLSLSLEVNVYFGFESFSRCISFQRKKMKYLTRMT